MNIDETLNKLIEIENGERTFYDGELVGVFFTMQNLKNLCDRYSTSKYDFVCSVMPLKDERGFSMEGYNNIVSSQLPQGLELYCISGENE
jgi:hypothetical protein